MSDESAGHRVFIERLVIAIAIIGFALLLWSLRALFMLVFGSLLVAVILNVLAAPLHRRLRLPRRLAMLGSVLILAGLIAAAIWIFGAEVTRQAESLRQTLPSAWTALEARLDAWALGDALRDWVANLWSAGNIGTIAASLSNALAATLLMLVAGVYLAARPELYRVGILKLVPAGGRGLVAEAIDDTARALRLWLLGRIVSMLAVGFLTWLGLVIIGVDSALTLGLLAGLLEFVPYVGPIASAVPAVLLAYGENPEMAVWTALLFLAVQQFEGYVLEPMVQQRAVDLPPALLLFALVAGGLVFGPIGIIFAEPLTVTLFVLVKRLYVRETLHTPTPIPGEAET